MTSETDEFDVIQLIDASPEERLFYRRKLEEKDQSINQSFYFDRMDVDRRGSIQSLDCRPVSRRVGDANGNHVRCKGTDDFRGTHDPHCTYQLTENICGNFWSEGNHGEMGRGGGESGGQEGVKGRRGGFSRGRALKNLIVLGTSFMLWMTSFTSLQYLQSSMNEHAIGGGASFSGGGVSSMGGGVCRMGAGRFL